jgi:hypothetical protein
VLADSCQTLNTPKTPGNVARTGIQSTPGFSAFRAPPTSRLHRSSSLKAGLDNDAKSTEKASYSVRFKTLAVPYY